VNFVNTDASNAYSKYSLNKMTNSLVPRSYNFGTPRSGMKNLHLHDLPADKDINVSPGQY